MKNNENACDDIFQGLDYWWVETARIKTQCKITTLAWNHDATRFLTAGEYLQLWQHEVNEDPVKFEIGNNEDHEKQQKTTSWSCLWKTRPANAIEFLAYSSDGSLFATSGANDRLVRVWYQNQQLMLPNQSLTQEAIRQAVCSNITFSFVYLAHPQSVTGISWRKTSKYMPRGSVGNMLVTSCQDNICRIWSETILPEDGIVSMSHLDPNAAQNAKYRTHRQKARFVQRFRHLRQSFAARRVVKNAENGGENWRRKNGGGESDPVATLPSTYSVHEFHNYGFQGTGISPGLHFHLSGTINALTDIPLVPAMSDKVDKETGSGQEQKHKFVLHWLNNKEMEFTVQAEKIMEDLLKMALERNDVSDEAFEYELTHPDNSKGIDDKNEKVKNLEVTSHGSQASLAMSEQGGQGSASAPSTANISLNLSDTLDHRIESILKEWHQDSDLLFAIHPIDGSLLVWIADYLDEYQPGSFRQAQISFSSRIPNALPIGDAVTMGSGVCIYNSGSVNFREMFKSYEVKGYKKKDQDEDDDNENLEEESKQKTPEKTKKKRLAKYMSGSTVAMISKHNNGTLNLWNVMFSEKSKFSSMLNISHKSRASGHRFRVNDITCHPVLPLLLTTSHHNVVHGISNVNDKQNPDKFCSELILWRVDPVGPLSKSGGITELARINSQEISAFSDVAWIPTLLPSSTLGSITNSPSACFVASDGQRLRVYQAVIDARTLLGEMNQGSGNMANSKIMESSLMSMSSQGSSTNANQLEHAAKLAEKFKIVSKQSSARPGAIIELEPIEDAVQDWQNTMLLQTFQEQVILSQGSFGSSHEFTSGLITSNMSAMVDLQDQFSEPFYVLLMEKVSQKVQMHMWRLVLSSEPEQVKDYDSSGSATPEPGQHHHHHHGHVQMSQVHVSTEKVSTQMLPLPEGVQVVHAVPAVGHLSSSSIYPACLAPYCIVTACSDKTIRFWRAKMSSYSAEDNSPHFEWEEWKMASSDGNSAIEVPGRPVSVSAAYTGRVAIAYQTGTSFHKQGDQDSRYVNLCTAIYECESTGGSQWIREDVIHLKNIELQAEMPPMDLTVFNQTSTEVTEKMHKFAQQMTDDLDNSESSKVKGKPLNLLTLDLKIVIWCPNKFRITKYEKVSNFFCLYFDEFFRRNFQAL